MHRLAPPKVAAIGLLVAASGCTVAVLAEDATVFLTSQVLIGAGSGFLWPAAVVLVGRLVGPDRRGLAMGIFGTAFSGGLVLAALLVAAGDRLQWRTAFAIAAVLAAGAAVSVLLVEAPDNGPARSIVAGVVGTLGIPSLVGVVAGVSQYATVSFLPVFAVEVWALTPGVAALVLAAGRILSIPLKIVVGVTADRIGPERAAAALGLALGGTGLVWALAPGRWPAALGAVVFAGMVSGLFPLANLLALTRSGQQGSAIGVFRAVQIGAAAIVGLLLGLLAERYGLRATIAVAVCSPALLLAPLGTTGPASEPDVISG